MGEHSPVDALVPSIVCDYAVVQEIDVHEFVGQPPVGDAKASSRRWRRLDWTVDEHIRRECARAEERATKIVEDSDDSVLWFTAYGVDWIKQGQQLL